MSKSEIRNKFKIRNPNVRRSQTRGVTAFAPMADTADHWDDLQFANLVAANHRDAAGR